jgi:prepilin-type processing-associated H-X9-DG protein
MGYVCNGAHYTFGNGGSSNLQAGMAPMDPKGMKLPQPNESAMPAGVPYARCTRIGTFNDPASLILLCDKAGWDGSPAFNTLWTPSYSSPGRYEFAHRGGKLVFLFADGHAESMLASESCYRANLWTPYPVNALGSNGYNYLKQLEAAFR